MKRPAKKKPSPEKLIVAALKWCKATREAAFDDLDERRSLLLEIVRYERSLKLARGK